MEVFLWAATYFRITGSTGRAALVQMTSHAASGLCPVRRSVAIVSHCTDCRVIISLWWMILMWSWMRVGGIRRSNIVISRSILLLFLMRLWHHWSLILPWLSGRIKWNIPLQLLLRSRKVIRIRMRLSLQHHKILAMINKPSCTAVG